MSGNYLIYTIYKIPIKGNLFEVMYESLILFSIGPIFSFLKMVFVYVKISVCKRNQDLVVLSVGQR